MGQVAEWAPVRESESGAHAFPPLVAVRPPAVRFLTTYLTIFGLWSLVGVLLLGLRRSLEIPADGEVVTSSDVALARITTIVFLVTAHWLRRGDVRGRLLFFVGLPATTLAGLVIDEWHLSYLVGALFILVGTALLLTHEAELFMQRQESVSRRFGPLILPLPNVSPAAWAIFCGFLFAVKLASDSVEVRTELGVLLLAAAWVLARHPQENFRPLGWLFMALLLATSPYLLAFLQGFIHGAYQEATNHSNVGVAG